MIKRSMEYDFILSSTLTSLVLWFVVFTDGLGLDA